MQKKKHSIIVFSMILSTFIVSCEVSNQNEHTSSGILFNSDYSSQKATTQTAAPNITGLISDFADLVKSSQNKDSMIIMRNKDEILYRASQQLCSAVFDLLSKSEQIYPNIEEGHAYLHDYDFKQYDYRLRFQNAKDILFSISDGSFHFEGETKLYKLYWDSSNFWNELQFSDQSVDLPDSGYNMMKTSQLYDINNDGTIDNISLIYQKSKTELGGNLILDVNGVQTTVKKQIIWSTQPHHIVIEPPQLLILPNINNQSSILAVSICWSTNGVGSTEEIYGYYFDGVVLSPVDIHIPEIKKNISAIPG